MNLIETLFESGHTIAWDYISSFQFLPDADFTIAISYLELHHDWFHFNADNGYVSIVLRGGADGFYGTLGVVFRATDFTSFSPTISFSYIS